MPDHELVARIGGGSYGDVWLARSVTGRMRAVKVVWRQNFPSDRPYEREFRGIVQFEPISRSHPGVVNVLHVGRDDAAGCFFYVMELADNATGGTRNAGDGTTTEHREGNGAAESGNGGAGHTGYVARTLAADLKRRGRLPVAQVLASGVQLADALGHIHRHGLVHRDVKPSNVIFVDGQAKLADIGLIAGVDEARSFVGTEGFIPPEGPGTVQADLFGLGRLLYEAATGKDRCDFPDLPTDLEGWSDRALLLELNEILSRACAPNPKQRHANAAELAGDLNLLLSGRSIRRAYGSEHRLRRATQVAVLAAVVALLAAIGVWVEKAQRQRADARTRDEAGLRERAEHAEQVAREQLRESLLQQALAMSGSSEPDRRTRALAALEQAAELRPGLDLRNAAIAALAKPELRVIRRWNPRREGSFHERPDARLERYSRRNSDGTISIHSMSDDVEIDRLSAVGVMAHSAGFSPDGRWLAIRYEGDALRAWDLTARTRFLVGDAVRAFGFTADSRRILTSSADDQLRLHDLETGEVVWRQAMTYRVRILALHPFEPLLAVAGEGRTDFEVRSSSDGHVERIIRLPEMGFAARWSADGRSVITAHSDFSVRVWDWPSMDSPRLIMRFHRSDPVFLAVDSADRWLATAGWDNQSALYDLRDGRMLFSQAGTAIYAALDRPRLLLANDAEWSLVEFEPPYAINTVPVHDVHKSPRELAFSPDGSLVATGGQDGIRILDRRTGEVHPLMKDEMAHRLAFDRDAEQLVAVTPHRLRAWRIRVPPTTDQLETDALPLRAQGDRGFQNVDVSMAGVTPDGKRWLAVATDSTNGGWYWISGRFDNTDVLHLAATTPGSYGPEFSADQRWLAWGNWRGRDAYVLALGTDEGERRVRLPIVGSASVAFSPDNRMLAVGGSEEIRFLEVGSWRMLHSFARLPGGQLPPHMTFMSDSKLSAVVLPPDQVTLVNTVTGAKLATLPGESRILVKAAFSPDNRFLAAVSTDHHLLIWDLDSLRVKLSTMGLDW